jgi:hypothetical protein
MTEHEWLTTNNAEVMRSFVEKQQKAARTKQGRRKLRLFGTACFRSYVEHDAPKTKPRDLAMLREVLDVAERYADGLASKDDLRLAREKDHRIRKVHDGLVVWLLSESPQEAWLASRHYYLGDPTWPYEATDQRRAAMMREIFGNPFRVLEVPSRWVKWNDGVILKLAQAAYDERELPQGILRPAQLGVLADAFEEAGCTNKEMLAHLREVGPHVRGCWVVDLLLGKQ